MVHSKDQVCQGASTSTSLSDSNKTAGKQIFVCFIEFFFCFTYSYTYKLLERKVKCASYGCSGCYLTIFLLEQKLGDCCIQQL